MLGRIAIILSLAVMSFVVPGAVGTADAGDQGMVVVAMGGGSLQDVSFKSGSTGDATFSFMVGFDKHDNLKGSFHMKRVYPASQSSTGGVRAIISTEITGYDYGVDPCPWIEMTGIGMHEANWSRTKPPPRHPYPDHPFIVRAYDCDGDDELPDMIWFSVMYPYPDDDKERPALTLQEDTELTKGNIMVR